MSDEASESKQWFPLESNPDVMNKYIEGLGFPLDQYRVTDVFSTESWALDMVPRPVVGVLFLYPIKEASEAHRAEEAERIEREGQELSERVYFLKQNVGNACGTVGLVHCVANAGDHVRFAPGTFFDKFLTATKGLSPDERAAELERSDDLEASHEAAAAEGQSAVPDHNESVDTHFICFTHVDGHLYEMDGRKKFPINHGPTSPDTLLEDSIRVIKSFMERDPDEERFTILALARVADE